MFPRPPLQPPDAPTRGEQSDLVTLTFSPWKWCPCRVWRGLPLGNFGLPRPLCSRLRPDVRDRQTDVRQKHARLRYFLQNTQYSSQHFPKVSFACFVSVQRTARIADPNSHNSHRVLQRRLCLEKRLARMHGWICQGVGRIRPPRTAGGPPTNSRKTDWGLWMNPQGHSQTFCSWKKNNSLLLR